ncbi:MAG: 4-alpha-glucanotransferase, partial [Myxococcota bacterium]
MDQNLAERCAAAGIATQYRDGDGVEHVPSPEALEAVLGALTTESGGETATIVDADRHIERLFHHLPERPTALTTEAGETISVDVHEGLVAIPPLPAGYHVLHAGDREIPVLATPARTYCPAPWPRGKAWGLQVQLYGLRGSTTKPIGDLGDLTELGRIATDAGASFIGINPLHTLFPEWPTARSPYSPSSRLFLNPIYLDTTSFPGGDVTDGGDGDLIDYSAAWQRKSAAFKAAFEAFDGDAAFDSWRREQGEALERHAVFKALSQHFAAKPWTEWPEEFRDPNSQTVSDFGAENAEAVTYAAWLQWQCALQLDAAAEAAPDFGLYRDLAVGADRAGSEYWGQQDLFAATLDVGAPPDGFSPNGQNWGLPPLKPAALRTQAGLDHFRRLIGANMAGSGLLRIDHAFQLERLFVVPHGFENREGTYIAYPLDLLLAVLKIESHRHRCIVVAEDLGTP